MKKALFVLAAIAVMSCATTRNGPVPDAQQLFKKAKLETWNRKDVGGGTGTLAGKFSFTRNSANPEWIIREIGWMTLAPGHSIGLHSHADNDDAYIIISGTGEFTNSEGVVFPVGPKDVTIAHPGQKHALKNTGKEDLYFLDVVSKNITPDAAWAKEQQLFKAEDLKTWDRQNVAGGAGTLAGKFSYTRNDRKTFPLYEIGWMTLAPGSSIGLHEHADNEDAYIIVSGAGTFSGSDGREFPAGKGDITIARFGQKHALSNTGKTDLIFLDIVAK